MGINLPPQKRNKMARLTKKAISNAVDAAFNKHGNNVQFDIFDLGKISSAGEQAAAIGGLEAIDQAVIEAIQKYRKN